MTRSLYLKVETMNQEVSYTEYSNKIRVVTDLKNNIHIKTLPNFVQEHERDGENTVVAAIDVVSQEQVVGFRRTPRYREEFLIKIISFNFKRVTET